MNALMPWRTRISPWMELEGLQERFDRMLGRMPSFAEEPMEWAPAVNLEESDAEFVLTAEFPGMTEKDVEIDIEQNVLTLRGEKRTEREEKKEKDGRWHLIERSYGAFQRSFTLPRTVNPEAIKAEFSDGLLTIHLPKRKESTARKVEIHPK